MLRHDTQIDFWTDLPFSGGMLKQMGWTKSKFKVTEERILLYPDSLYALHKNEKA